MSTPRTKHSRRRNVRARGPRILRAAGAALCIGCFAWAASCAAASDDSGYAESDVATSQLTESPVATSQPSPSDEAPGTLVWRPMPQPGHVCNEGLHLLEVLELRQDDTWLYVALRHHPAIEDENAPRESTSATAQIGFEGDTSVDIPTEGTLRSDVRAPQWVYIPLDTLPPDTEQITLSAFGARVAIPLVSDGTRVHYRTLKEFKGVTVTEGNTRIALDEGSGVLEVRSEVRQ